MTPKMTVTYDLYLFFLIAYILIFKKKIEKKVKSLKKKSKEKGA